MKSTGDGLRKRSFKYRDFKEKRRGSEAGFCLLQALLIANAGNYQSAATSPLPTGPGIGQGHTATGEKGTLEPGLGQSQRGPLPAGQEPGS